MTLDHTNKYLIEEFAEDYQDGRMGRRELLQRTLLLAGGVGAAAGVLRGLIDVKGAAAAAKPAYPRLAATIAPGDLRAAAQNEPGAKTMPPSAQTTTPVVPQDDPEIVASMVEFPGEAGTVFGYLARPAAAGSYPAIITVHENRGMIEPNMDIARRFAKEGFVALAVDLISRAGGTASFAGDIMAIMAAQGQQTDATRLADMLAALEYLKTLPFVNTAAGFGVTGFCFGGGQTFSLAARSPDIRAAVPFYGSAMPDNLAGTQAAVLAIYAENDPRITMQAPDVEAAVMRAGRPVETVIYPASGHGFFNNTGDRYNPTSAQDAWRRVVGWFTTHLAGV
jgi:carboxymethylenebutenolidase